MMLAGVRAGETGNAPPPVPEVVGTDDGTIVAAALPARLCRGTLDARYLIARSYACCHKATALSRPAVCSLFTYSSQPWSTPPLTIQSASCGTAYVKIGVM